MPFPYLAGATRAAESTDGSVFAPGAVPPASGAPSSKPAGDLPPRSAASARGSLSSSRGSGPLNFAEGLKEMLARVPCDDMPNEPAKGHREEALAALTADEVHLLLHLIEDEGMHRGWGTFWWEHV